MSKIVVTGIGIISPIGNSVAENHAHCSLANAD
jgi:3-oxoacyl-(acyl-carrier-protein) synthase